MTTRTKRTATAGQIEALVTSDPELLKTLMKAAIQEVLEAEMTEAVGAGPGERTGDRVGYRSGYYSRGLVTRIGKLELRVPRDREGRFSTELFDRYQRSEKALVSALAEMYVQGVSTRKVKAVTEELCGHTFSASTVSRINKSLDALLRRFAQRRLDEAYPYVILDARYEKVRLDGVIQSQAVFIALGINAEGRRQVLGVELSNRESTSSWTTFVTGLKTRACRGWSLSCPTITRGSNRPCASYSPQPSGSAAMCTSCGTPSTTCRAKPTTTAGRNSAGSMTDAISKRPSKTCRRGSRAGSSGTPSSPTGSKPRSARP
jgi:putative transposase